MTNDNAIQVKDCHSWWPPFTEGQGEFTDTQEGFHVIRGGVCVSCVPCHGKRQNGELLSWCYHSAIQTPRHLAVEWKLGQQFYDRTQLIDRSFSCLSLVTGPKGLGFKLTFWHTVVTNKWEQARLRQKTASLDTRGNAHFTPSDSVWLLKAVLCEASKNLWLC